MPKGELKAKVTADISQFERGLDRAQKLASSAASGIKSKLAGAATAVGGALAAGYGVNAVVQGVQGVIQAGGALADLSDQTGASIKNLVILQKRFTDAGLQAEDAGAAINKMQKYMEALKDDSGKQGAIRDLGLSVAELFAMSPERQFETIGRAIGKLDSASERAAKAMEIFGKAGGKLTRVFQGDIFGNVDSRLAKQAETMARNAKQYDELGDKLGGENGVLKTFYRGIASSVVPALNTTVDRLQKLDLGAEGKKFGDALVTGATLVLKAVEAAQNFTTKGGTAERALGEDGLSGAAGRASEYFTSGKFKWSDLKPNFGRDQESVAERAFPPAARSEMRARDFGGMNDRTGGGDPENNLRDRLMQASWRSRQMSRFMSERAGASSAFYKRLNPGGVDFESALRRTSMAETRLGTDEDPGATFRDGTSTRRTGAFGRSATGLNVDTAETARQTRARLMEDARFTNPLATGAQLNGIVNQQMQEGRDKQRADQVREKINEGRRSRGEEELKAPVSEAQQAYEAALRAVLPDWAKATAEGNKELVAQ